MAAVFFILIAVAALLSVALADGRRSFCWTAWARVVVVMAERLPTIVDDVLSMMFLPCRRRFSGSVAEFMTDGESQTPMMVSKGVLGNDLSILSVIEEGDSRR